MSNTFTRQFQFERETKGALRYMEIDGSGAALAIGDGAAIGTLYVRKTAYNGSGHPQRLTVTVTASD
jgi:hypothetical protein